MKKLDLVKLKNDRPYKSHNLNKDMHGIVVDVNFDNADVLFFNPRNVGDYAILLSLWSSLRLRFVFSA